jgi:hypothetical protein
VPQTNEPAVSVPNVGKTQPQRFYKLLVKAWTSFDPANMDLSEIAEFIDDGSGFLSSIEVVSVAEDLRGIDDAEVREGFANLLAADRVLQNIADLPTSVRQRLAKPLASDNPAPRGVAA